MSQFQSSITRPPPIPTNRAIANGAMRINSGHLRFMCSSSVFRRFVSVAKAFPQAQDRVVLPRQKRVDAEAGFGGEVLEGATFDLVGHEDRALVFRQRR